MLLFDNKLSSLLSSKMCSFYNNLYSLSVLNLFLDFIRFYHLFVGITSIIIEYLWLAEGLNVKYPFFCYLLSNSNSNISSRNFNLN